MSVHMIPLKGVKIRTEPEIVRALGALLAVRQGAEQRGDKDVAESAETAAEIVYWILGVPAGDGFGRFVMNSTEAVYEAAIREGETVEQATERAIREVKAIHESRN